MRRRVLGALVAVSAFLALLALGPCRESLSLGFRYWSRTKPIVFYGKVVDRHGEPIPGARVTVGVQAFGPHDKGFLRERRISYTTDANGRFTVEGVSGTTLGVLEIEKPGYVRYPNPYHNTTDQMGFGYSRDRGVPYYVPDPTRPAVFPLQGSDEGPPPLPSRGGRDEPNPW